MGNKLFRKCIPEHVLINLILGRVSHLYSAKSLAKIGVIVSAVMMRPIKLLLAAPESIRHAKVNMSHDFDTGSCRRSYSKRSDSSRLWKASQLQ